MTETTKQCKCGNTHLILVRTQNKKLCSDCGNVLDWFLDENQKPVGYNKE